MLVLTIVIKMENAAFDVDREFETARILRTAADKVQDGCVATKLRDINGNTIGNLHIDGF